MINSEDRNTLKKSVKFLKKQKIQYFMSLIITLTAMAFGVFQPLLFGNVIDFINHKNFMGIVYTIFMISAIYLISIFLGIAKNIVNVKISNTIEYDIKTTVFNKIFNYQQKKFDKVKKGEFMEKIEQDSKVFSSALLNELTNIIMDIGSVVIMGFIIVKINLFMTIFLIALFPVSLVISNLWAKKIRKIQEEFKLKRDFLLSFFQEMLSGFKTIKIYNLENNVSSKYSEKLKDINKTVVDTTIKGSYVGAASQFVGMNGSIGILSLGIYFIFKGDLTLGGLVAFNSYSGSFSGSLFRLSQINSRLQQSFVSLKRIFDILDEEDNIYNNSTNIISMNNSSSEKIEIRNMWFKYNDEYILKNISLDIKKNSINAIAGLSGSGKSTLANIIMGLYDDYEGEIFLEGIPYSTLNREEIIRNIALVTQDTFMMTGTIKENLLMGKKDASDEEITSVCKKAYISDFIESLPDRYETKIGYNGIDLSGGQKQRISLARALLKNPDIFILDEITSALDGKSEKEIVKLIKEISESHTVILISHRLSTIGNSDNIILMKDGEIMNSGDHEYLISNDTYYEALFGDLKII